MNFYDKIKSPFEDDETIIELINIFSKRQDKLYYDIIHNSSEEEIDNNTYMEKFDENIFWPLTENDWKNYVPKAEERATFNKFKSYKDLWNYINQLDPYILNKLSKYFLYSKMSEQNESGKRFKRELEQASANSEELISAKKLQEKILETNSYKDEGIMGFHFDSQLHDKTAKRETPEVKFYINAGEDSYKVAKLFLDKCREKKMESYYFKVVDPMQNEQGRTDKLCIYSTVEDAKSFLDIIKQIQIENPDINFNKPPLTTGVIDNFIGFGTDTLDNDLSYNQTIADVVTESFMDFFSKMNVKYSQSFEYIKKHPELLKQIRQILSQKSAEKGCERDKICLTDDIAKKLKTVELSSTKSKENERMQFVERFMDLYDNTETEYQLKTRTELESGSIQRVLDIVEKKGMQISDLIDVRYIEIDGTGEKRPQYTQKQFSAMARLLKAAEGLNNDKNANPDGINYLKQFTAVPQIENILLAMAQDFKNDGSYLHQLRKEYKENKNIEDISTSLGIEEVSKQTTSQTSLDEESEQQKKTSSQNFRESLYKKRSENKTGMNDVKKAQSDMALRTERGRLSFKNQLGQLDEDGKRRLEELNKMLNIQNINLQQYEANKRKHGQSR